METLHLLYNYSNVEHLNLEENLFSHFDINEIIPKNFNMPRSFINLKYNFIRNTSIHFYTINSNNSSSFSIELFGNPLMCDCSSMWMLKEARDLLETTRNRNSYVPHKMYYKRRKNVSKFLVHKSLSDPIKMIFKRSAETISSHYLKDDPNLEIYLQRQKRLRNGKIFLRSYILKIN